MLNPRDTFEAMPASFLHSSYTPPNEMQGAIEADLKLACFRFGNSICGLRLDRRITRAPQLFR
jgi:hypothetical protein